MRHENDIIKFLAEVKQIASRLEDHTREWRAILQTLTAYYETALTKERRLVREACKKTIQEISPSYYEGYFNTPKTKKANGKNDQTNSVRQD